jgi:hypothetical protein
MLHKNLKPLITRMNTDTRKLARKAFAARMGQKKAKTLQASLIDFRFFLPIPACWDLLPCSRIARPARDLLTIKYAACI